MCACDQQVKRVQLNVHMHLPVCDFYLLLCLWPKTNCILEKMFGSISGRKIFFLPVEAWKCVIFLNSAFGFMCYQWRPPLVMIWTSGPMTPDRDGCRDRCGNDNGEKRQERRDDSSYESVSEDDGHGCRCRVHRRKRHDHVQVLLNKRRRKHLICLQIKQFTP